ncbi:MAG: Unknown protein [uncultured Sulfurovum sp.]|uniref:PIN domain-containing protein n=1 Tax=uncultured Sulfurovum sp. TaxID=269237 RepID=A0A6S6SWA1_9BACT|nr:MAG: Unknown protein [uncultured Sulfurovum sp.]
MKNTGIKMIEEKKKISLLQNSIYMFKFLNILFQEKLHPLKMLKVRFIHYRDSSLQVKNLAKETTELNKSLKSSIKTIPKKHTLRTLNYPLLILFDAENMPIQEHYKLIRTIVIEEFGSKSWNKAKLETAYKESTEFYNNAGYNQSINTHYVDYGKDKADDKLVEIAQNLKIPNIIIVSNDNALIIRLQEVSNTIKSGKFFAYNGRFLKEYTKTNEAIKKSKLQSLKEKREQLFKEYTQVNQEIEHLEKTFTKAKKITYKAKQSIPKTIKKKPTLSKNLIIANLDENIRKDLTINPLFINFTEKLVQVDAPSHKEAKIQVHKVLKVFETLPAIHNLLKTKGLEISVFKIALRYAINEFDVNNYQSNNFIEFIQEMIEESAVKLVLKKPSQYKLLFKETLFNELEMSEVLKVNDYGLKEGVLENNFSTSLDSEFLKNLKSRL